MSSELPYVMTRLPAEYVCRWKSHCASLGMTSSDALRAAMSRFMAGDATPVRYVAKTENPDKPRRRQEIRLADSEIDGISELAQAFGASRAKYLVNLVRGHLLQEPQLGMAELAVIGESNQQLRAIGRNLNQVALALNRGGHSADLLPAIARLTTMINEHTQQVNAVIRSNLERWRVTWR